MRALQALSIAHPAKVPRSAAPTAWALHTKKNRAAPPITIKDASRRISARTHSGGSPRIHPGGEAFKPRNERIFFFSGFSRGVSYWEVPGLKPEQLLGDCSLATLKHCPTHESTPTTATPALVGDPGCMGSHPNPSAAETTRS